MRGCLSLVVVLVWMNCVPLVSMDKSIKKPIPVVIEAKLPLYPSNARVSNISGTVKLKVITDGSAVTKIVVIEGPPMLSIAAKAMISEWKFLQHDPTDFVVTIQYVLNTSENRINDVINFDVSTKIVINGVRTKG